MTLNEEKSEWHMVLGPRNIVAWLLLRRVSVGEITQG